MKGLMTLDEAADADLGGKGSALAWLQRHGYPVPPTWVVPPGREPDLSGLDTGRRYAVRSSANVEDGGHSSYAGQFLTELDLELAEIPAAVEAVRSSAGGEAIESYVDHTGERRDIDMSVLIQEMVTPVVSGVVFTRNPITGLNEVVLEAVTGRGDRLVGEGVTPQRWVRHWGEWTSAPVDPILPDELAATIAARSAAAADEYGRAADLEWVWDGETLWWVQIRPITGLDDVAVYSNRISKEVMPGMIKPLVWSVNVPVVNRAWIALFTEAIGDNELEPDDLAKSFAYRSYFNMGAIGDIFELLGMPRDSLELLLGLPEGPDKPRFKPSAATVRKTPRLLAFAIGKSGFGKDGDKLLGGLRASYRRYDDDVSAGTDGELVAAVDELMELGTEAAYANIVVPLLANLYGGLLRRRLDKHGIDPAGVELSDDPADHELDPNPALDRLAEVIEAAGAESTEAQSALAEFLETFGHFSDSGNDFSVPPWREQPELVLQMASARGGNMRTTALEPWSEARTSMGRFRGIALEPLRKRAVRYELRREQVSSLYTYGYGLFRRYFLELGRRFVDRGLLEEPDDVMMLTLDQVKLLVAGTMEAAEARELVAGHRREYERVADLPMPETIYGDDFIAVDPADPATVLRGVATSRGRHRGPVKVINGVADFAKLDQGDVLAIPYSDVGWTPLFAKAGAVLSEAGGMLSHSSIVAREYGIPCVVSVPGVTRLADGTVVTVDGYRGEVTPDPGSYPR
jgi:pyruvate,water dikinase